MTRQKQSEATGPADVDLMLRNFPLVCRPRLTCPDLGTRVAEVHAYALVAQQQNEPADRLNRACAAMNLAALIAADCGMRILATDLCYRHFQVFRPAWPLDGPTAVAALQPLANLARLRHRAGDPRGAYEALRALDTAVGGGTVLINDVPICLNGITATPADRLHASRWLRVLLLQDGTRLLAASGQWRKASAHASRYDDAPEHLGDGHQAEIIARLLDGRRDSALALFDTATTTEPRQMAVAACLRGCIDRHVGRLTAEGLARVLAAVEAAVASSTPDTALFHVRLGLTAAALAAAVRPVQADPVYETLIRGTERSQDAFAARELLSAQACRRRMRPTEASALAALVRNAGLGRGSIPEPLLYNLMTATEKADGLLTQALAMV